MEHEILAATQRVKPVAVSAETSTQNSHRGRSRTRPIHDGFVLHPEFRLVHLPTYLNQTPGVQSLLNYIIHTVVSYSRIFVPVTLPLMKVMVKLWKS